MAEVVSLEDLSKSSTANSQSSSPMTQAGHSRTARQGSRRNRRRIPEGRHSALAGREASNWSREPGDRRPCSIHESTRLQPGDTFVSADRGLATVSVAAYVEAACFNTRDAWVPVVGL